jgi:hypothetical protein
VIATLLMLGGMLLILSPMGEDTPVYQLGARAVGIFLRKAFKIEQPIPAELDNLIILIDKKEQSSGAQRIERMAFVAKQ